MAALLVASSGTAAAQEEPEAGHGHFSDDDSSVHEPALDALAAEGVLAGMECGDGLICPHEPLKRWEMAVWLVRVLDGADPAPVDSSRFEDVDAGRWSAPFVDRLATLDVTAGCATEPARFCPEGSVTRAQMASFLTRAFELETAPPAGFVDVDARGVHSANIDALASAGITSGCSRDPLAFCPAQVVTRAQMATFLARALGLIELPAAVRFTAIDAGYGHTCGLRADGTVSCWGANHLGQADAPDGQFLAVSAGGDLSCAIDRDLVVACWGATYLGLSDVPEGQFQSVSAGLRHACGLRIDGTVICWGSNYIGESDAPNGQFEAVTAGFGISCASGDAGLACWGDGSEDEELPEGGFVTLAAGTGHICGLREDSTVTCFGGDFDGQSDAPDGRFRSVSAGGEHTCGLYENQTIVCWGNSRDGRIDPPRGQFLAVTAGSTHSCGVRIDGTAVCWGDTADARSRAPEGQFTSVSAGGRHTCGLLTDSSIACWGYSGNGQAHAALGEFKAVAAGRRHTCAVGAESALVCWGASHYGAEVPAGRFSEVTAGGALSCGLRIDGTVACWGSNAPVEGIPEGRLTSLTTGFSHACGLRSDQAIVCWEHQLVESNRDLLTTAPGGRFKSVSAGSWHSCGVRVDGTVVCWGENFSGEIDVPPGRFDAVSAGGQHSCGIREDGTVACWGRNDEGQTQAPAGTFAAVSAGDEHSCGLRIDNAVVCWGHDTLAPPPGVRSPYAEGRPDPAACRVFGTLGLTHAGFPRHRSAAPTTGTVRVAVLFMDFPDAVASYSTRAEVGESLAFAERYLEEASYGALDIRFVPLHRWLRSENEHTHYLVKNEMRGFDSEAARLADPEVDFALYDILMTVLPGSHFGGGTATGSVDTAEGVVGPTVRINTFLPGLFLGSQEASPPSAGAGTSAQAPGTGDWGRIAAHELLHALGLADLYPISGTPELIEEPPGKLRFEAEFGIMGLKAFFLLDDDDQRMFTYFGGSDGETLAWSRWQLGWLDPDQIDCVTGDRATVVLKPVATDPGTGTAMAAVPLTVNEVIVIESRRSIGRDTSRLLEEGVLVYRVNASVETGLLPIKVVGVPDEGFPVLQIGESVTVRGYTITVVADEDAAHTVTITKTPGG